MVRDRVSWGPKGPSGYVVIVTRRYARGRASLQTRDLHGNFPAVLPLEIPRLKEQNVRVTRGKGNKY